MLLGHGKMFYPLVQAKMGCLDKSKLDWEQYVEEEGIKEELTTFNKGKHG
jgi:hypothetical protein